MNLKNADGKLWTPVRVKPKQEKKLARYCERQGIAFYLPLRRRVHRYQRRTAEFHVPMLPGYVFCCLDDNDLSQIVRSNTVMYRIRLSKREETQLLGELASLRAFESLENEIEVIVKPELIEGVRIAVVSGPLAGVSGIVEQRKDKTKISININILGQSASVELDIGDTEHE